MKLYIVCFVSAAIFAWTENVTQSPPAGWLWVASVAAALWRGDWLVRYPEASLSPYQHADFSSEDEGGVS